MVNMLHKCTCMWFTCVAVYNSSSFSPLLTAEVPLCMQHVKLYLQPQYFFTDVAEVVLNRCMVTIKKQNGTYVKKYYYEFLDDYHNKSHRTRVENIKSE